MVLDLRFNPGGLLPSAVNLADMFLEKGTVVSTRGRSSPEQVFETHSQDILMDCPMVVLVNQYSASASEIVTGALKDHERALIVGETTFGKGSVQSIMPLKNNKGAFKLTTARYYTPSGICIEDKGIKPHVQITLSDKENRKLARHLSQLPRYNEGKSKGKEKEKKQNEKNKTEEKFKDVQLQRAIDMLKALLIEQGKTPAESKAA